MIEDPFKDYIKQIEPDKKDKIFAWNTAIGLQNVDGLTVSKYLVDIATKNIEDEISIEEAKDLINKYYQSNKDINLENKMEVADKVSVNIVEILYENAFSLTPNEYISIHRRLFTGIYNHAGKIRNFNITKKEWVLDGNTVIYDSALELRRTLEYDISQEKNFSYKGLGIDEIIKHLSLFISNLWQIHIFQEGNTRTTAVFFIKYLRTLGFNVTNDIFAKNAWYFRNALVRANYSDIASNIHETTEYLELFLRNLLLNENNVLSNRMMHISGNFNSIVQIDDQKADIDNQRANIENQKADIENKLMDISNSINISTRINIVKIFNNVKDKEYFGRSKVEEITGLKSTRSSEIIELLLDNDLIVPVKGHGKGKYKFDI